MTTEYEWMSDAEPVWETTSSDNNYLALVPLLDEEDEVDDYDDADLPFADREFMIRVALKDADITLQVSNTGTAYTQQVYAEINVTGRELDDLILGLQRLRGQAEDERILAERRQAEEEAARRKERAAASAQWQKWIIDHPWVIVDQDSRSRSRMGMTHNGRVHRRACKHAPKVAEGVYDGYTTDEIVALETNRPIRNEHENAKPRTTDRYRNIYRCKLCTGYWNGWDPLPDLVEQEQDEEQDETTVRGSTAVEPVDLDAPGFRLDDPIMITAGEHEGHAGKFVAYRGDADGETRALVSLYYLTAARQGPVLVPLKAVEGDPDIPETP